jgi:hypothetical protein
VSDDDSVRALLSDSLQLWRVEGVVEPGETPVLAVIRARTGAIVWIERVSAADIPFRWAVRSRAAGDAPGGAREVRPKACSALLGLLKAVRNALGVDRGSPIRVAPQPDRACQ